MLCKVDGDGNLTASVWFVEEAMVEFAIGWYGCMGAMSLGDVCVGQLV